MRLVSVTVVPIENLHPGPVFDDRIGHVGSVRVGHGKFGIGVVPQLS